MPELATATASGLPTINFQPINPSSYINPAWVPDPLPPDLRGAYRTLGQAGVLGAVSRTIAALPDAFQKSYQQGQQNTINAAEVKGKLAGLQLKSDILANGTTPDQQTRLQGVTLGPDGSTSIHVPAPFELDTNRLKMEDIRAQVAQRNALATKALQFSQGGGIENPSLIQPLPASAARGGGIVSPGDEDLVDTVKKFEGFNPNPYNDHHQTSIGYGTRAKPGDTKIDEGEATVRLNAELNKSALNVDSAIANTGAQLSPRQRDALISFDYNTGAGANVLLKSGGDPAALAKEMASYTHVTDASGNKVLSPGLVNRRKAEIAMLIPPGAAPGAAAPATQQPTPVVAQPLAALRLAPEEPIPGMPFSMQNSTTPVLPQTTDSAPVAAGLPVSAPAAQDALMPDGTIHLDRAAAASGGTPIGTGRSGGDVERFNGFDREKLPGGNFTIYPHKLRTPGQPDHYDTKLPIQAPAKLRSEAEEMGINVDGMSQGDIGKAMDDKEKADGTIRPSRLPVAQRMASFVVGHPALKHLPTIREAKETVDAGLANPGAGGFGDMALIEGFQRMVNPGATVRTQTMNNMQQATGWLAQLDPSYQWGKATIGDKLTPAARQRIKVLSDDIYNKTLANAKPQLDGLKRMAKSYGINNPDDFVNNTLSLSPLLAGAESGAPQTPGAAPVAPTATMVRMQKPPNPDGTPGAIIMVPAANVAAAQALNATIVK